MPIPSPHKDETEKDFIARCMSDETMQSEYDDNEQRAGVCYSQWRNKESRRESMLSDENKKNLLLQALTTEYGLKQEDPKPKSLTIDEVFESYIVYDIDGTLYQTSYELNESDEVVFTGEPKKVTATKIFKPLESLQTIYSEIIQEAGRRNAARDAKRLRDIMASIQELLSDDEPLEKDIKKVTKEASKVLEWLQTLESVKVEDGISFPSDAYAYVEDVGKSDSWKMRMWEDLDKKVTKARLNQIAASFSPGGYKGVKADIPESSFAAVKRKIRAQYRKIGVEVDDMPKWVREAETREEIWTYVPLTEATFDKGVAKVTVIKAGFNATEDRYYPAEVLKRDYGIFEGQKMYADHPTDEEDKARPERSIKDWVATLTEVKCDDAGTVTGTAKIIESWMMQKLAALRDSEMLSEMGISINAIGSATKGKIDNKETLIIERLVEARSVDFVTEPGAGGIVTFYESDRSRDVDLIEITGLKEKRPDLVKLIEADIREEITQEVKSHMEDTERIKELEGANETLTTERDGLKTQIEEAEKAKAKAEAQATVKEAVDKAELPDAAKERLVDRFKDAESPEGIEEAIQSEKDYIAKLSEAGKVIKLGKTQVDAEKDKEGLKESAKKLHPEYTEEQIETFVAGR